MPLKGKKCPRVGTKVRAAVNPVSAMMYSPGHGPTDGATGVVTTVPLPGGRKTCLPGPGGGLVYVKWDDGRTFGVSRYDLETTKSKGGLSGRGLVPASDPTLRQYGKCVRKCKRKPHVGDCIDKCFEENPVNGVGAFKLTQRGDWAWTADNKSIYIPDVRVNFNPQQHELVPVRGSTTQAVKDSATGRIVGWTSVEGPLRQPGTYPVAGLGASSRRFYYGNDPAEPEWVVVDTTSGQTRYHWFNSRREAEVWNGKYKRGTVQSAQELGLRPWQQPGFEGAAYSLDPTE